MDLRKFNIPDLKKLDKKLINKLAIALIAIVAIVVIIIVAKLMVGTKTSYENIEKLMVKAAKEYYTENETGINSFKEVNNNKISVNIETLVESKYLKDLSKLVKDKDATCKGSVSAKMNNGYILYTPELDCGIYKTKKLNSVITSVTVDSGNGLYLVGDSYVYRGEKLNNNIKFAGKDWLIMRVNADGTMKLLETTKREKIEWDDRYNIEAEGRTGINDFNVSRIKDALIELYDDKKEFSDNDKSYIVPQTLCIGKRGANETKNDNSVECSNVVENWMIGLVTVSDYMTASLDTNCKYYYDGQCANYNYFADITSSYWSITADSTKTSKVFKLTSTPTLTLASNEAGIRAVILLDSDSIYVKGDGSLENPYIFK